jgi:hypothetical protein
MSRKIPGYMNLTLAAYYGEKPEHLAELIRWCQTSVAKEVPRAFRPYELGQVHATIVGLEGMRKDAEVFNTNYDKLGQRRSMNLKAALDFLNSTSLFPFRVRIGGFRIGDEYTFTSRGQHPYLRSFTVQSSNIVVAMGWPEKDGGFPNTLGDLRRDFNKYNIIHKYHKIDDAFDNDLFFVLGKVDPVAITDTERQVVSEIIRVQMAAIEPIYLDVTREVLSLVAYVNEELPPASSVQIPISKAVAETAQVIALYQGAT